MKKPAMRTSSSQAGGGGAAAAKKKGTAAAVAAAVKPIISASIEAACQKAGLPPMDSTPWAVGGGAKRPGVGDKTVSMLDSINRFSDDCLAGLLVEEDFECLGDQMAQQVPVRLAQLQQQLEQLEAGDFCRLRNEAIQAGRGAEFQTNDALLASATATANKTEISLGTLKNRLVEIQHKMVLNSQAKAAAAAKEPPPKLVLPSTVKPGGFPAEGDAYDDEDDESLSDGLLFDDDGYYGDDLEESDFEEVHGILRGGGHEALALRKIVEAARRDTAGAGATPEAELENALTVFSSPHLTMEEKMGLVQKKFVQVLQHDQYWRGEAEKTAKRLQDARLQKRLTDIERERVLAINSRLEGFCRDLQAENRKMKIEAAKVDEAVKLAMEMATLPSPAASTSSTQSSGGKKSKKPRREQLPVPPSAAFPFPGLPTREDLGREDKTLLVDRLLGLADLYQARDTHFAAITEGRDLEAKLAEAKMTQQQLLLERTIAKLDLGESRVNELARNEADLKSQVRQYVDKFRQVEETLVKSNELFGTFRGEMEQMSAKLAKLERENTMMHSKCATLSRNIIEMADDRAKNCASIETLKAQKAKLEQLCRTLQAERAAARKADEVLVEARRADEVPVEAPEAPPAVLAHGPAE